MTVRPHDRICVIKPSNIIVPIGPPPLVGCFGSSEVEYTIAVVVAVCQRNGDAWQAVTDDQLLEFFGRAGRAWAVNPFLRPASVRSVDLGLLVREARGLALTSRAIDVLARSRYRRSRRRQLGLLRGVSTSGGADQQRHCRRHPDPEAPVGDLVSLATGEHVRYMICALFDRDATWHTGHGGWSPYRGDARRYASLEEAMGDIAACDPERILDLVITADVDPYALAPGKDK